MTLRNLFLRLVARRDNTTSSTNANAPKASAGQLDWLHHAASAPAADLLAELNTTEEGLDSASVDTARELWGANAQVHATARPLPRRLAAAFADPFTYILVLIAAVSVLTDWTFAAPGARDLTTPLIIGARGARLGRPALHPRREERRGRQLARRAGRDLRRRRARRRRRQRDPPSTRSSWAMSCTSPRAPPSASCWPLAP